MSQLVGLLPASHDIYYLTGPRGGVWTWLGWARCFQLSLEAAIGGQLEPARPPKAGRGEAPLPRAVGAPWQHSVPDGCWTEGLTSRAAGGQGPSSAPAARTAATQRPAHDQTPEEGITRRRGRRETSRAGRRLQVSAAPHALPASASF